MKSLTGTILLILATSVFTSQAQQPTPSMMIVQAASAQSSPSSAAASQSSTEENKAILQNAIKLLEQAKEANVDLLKKQDDMLAHLDDMQKAAEQLRIFAHRAGG